MNQLDNDELYSFQVFSVSTNQYESGSNEFEILTPKYSRQIQAITIGATTALLILLAIVGITLYMAIRESIIVLQVKLHVEDSMDE